MLRKFFNHISGLIQRRQYRKLYYRLFRQYSATGEMASFAIQQADEAFCRLTGTMWDDWL